MKKSENRAKRMAGGSLRAAAHLMANPLTKGLLFRIANDELGLGEIGTISIPDETPLYLPRHLFPSSDGEKKIR